MHAVRGESREDAIGVHPVDGGLVAVVADGHGMTRAFRAHVGSELAVQAVVAAVDRGKDRWSAGGEDAAAWLTGDFTHDVIAGWRDLVARHVSANPLSERSADPDATQRLDDATAPVPSQESVWVTYGSTVLMALATVDRVMVWQLGDGDILVGSETGGRAAVPEDAGNFANQTASICLADAERRARSAVWEVDDSGFLAVLATDGFGNAMAAPDWRSRLCEDLRSQITEQSFEDVADQLPAWSASCASASGDDVSVIVLSPDPAALSGARRRGAGLDDTLVETTRVETTRVETTRVEMTRVETTPIETAPVETTSIETAPVEKTPAVRPRRWRRLAVLGAGVLLIVAGLLTLFWSGALTPPGTPASPPSQFPSAGPSEPTPVPSDSVTPSGPLPSGEPTPPGVSPGPIASADDTPSGLPTATAGVDPPGPSAPAVPTR